MGMLLELLKFGIRYVNRGLGLPDTGDCSEEAAFPNQLPELPPCVAMRQQVAPDFSLASIVKHSPN